MDSSLNAPRIVPLASTVIVSNFVSVKLSGRHNYNSWKAQMLCLLECVELLYIINAENPLDKGDPMILQYDELVKGWIFTNLELQESELKYFRDLGTAREVWMKLESTFNQPVRDTDEGDSSNVSALTEGYKYKRAFHGVVYHVTVSNFVSVKLSGRNDYHIWKAQMLCLLESKELLHIINADYPFPVGKGVHMISRYDKLVKGWIFGSMKEKVLKDFTDYSSVQSIWRQLETRFNRPISYTEGDSVDVSALREDLKYIQVSNVNVSNFVTVKLSGYNNHRIWKAQMMCLLESQELLHIIEAETRSSSSLEFCGHMTKKYDNLVKGWILGTMNDQLLKTFAGYNSVQLIWKKLESKVFTPDVDTTDDSVGFRFETESIRDVPEIESTRKRLYEAAAEGCWWKAKSILKVHMNAAKDPITENGNTVLHLVVEMGHNYFLVKLLEFVKDEIYIEMQNDKGRTALHIAAMVGNEYAAQHLVQKRKQLLWILDSDRASPLDIAYNNRKFNISTYFSKTSLLSDLSSDASNNWTIPTNAILTAIYTKQYDLAGELLKKFESDLAFMGIILSAITITFPTDLGFMESFIYPSFNNVRRETMLRGFLLFHYNLLDKCVDDVLRVANICNYTCRGWLGKISMLLLVPIATIYPIYQLICLLFLLLHLNFSMLYFLLWKVLAVTVRPIKNIENKKKEYQEAKKVLSLICSQMGTSHSGYKESILEAVRQGTYEVVDEILFKSPSTINCKDIAGHNIIQLAIINRSEKVYNLIHHIIERIESYRTMKDSFKNNHVHLVGRLAPSFVLGRTTGAALQLQRELIWREEIEKLMLPLDLLHTNFDGDIPEMVFTKEHQDLMKQGEAWMKTTAESCSITAALIVTVVFAAAITVPGGSKQESGIPVFKKESAFTIFAVFNAFSLFTAATSLLLFLSILTARFSERDFLVSLPRRLILGLFTLFLSTTAMIVAFGAILFLVFCDQRPWMLAPICIFACLPISVIASIKLPLLVDLIQSTYIPIFGKQSYLDSCKISRKNTIFTK